jgi:hypothetical protein
MLLCAWLLLSSSIGMAAEDQEHDLSREAIAKELALVENHPNPFNAHTTIYYNLLKPAYVTVKIYDMAGRWIETLMDQYQEEGENFAVWKTAVDPSGTYIYRITVDDIVVYKKMSLIK